jgi:hypothetical protein
VEDCSSCCFIKPLSERQRLMLPRIPPAVHLGLTGALPCQQTLPAKAERSAKLAELRDLESEMAKLGVLEGPRWRGRKPKTA